MTTDAPTQPIMMPRQRHVRARSSLQLAAVPTAVSCSRMFVTATLRRWHLVDLDDDATLIMSELVTNAVLYTGTGDASVRLIELENIALIRATLIYFDDALIIEVADRSQEVPQKPNQDPDAEGGRGLLLVEALSRRWGVYFPDGGGKSVWAELDLPKPRLPLPRRTRKPRDAKPASPVDNIELLLRVRDGLKRLH